MNTPQPVHISAIVTRTAKVLASINLVQDAYHNAIQAAAIKLCAEGKGDAVYIGSDGKTIWERVERFAV